MQFSREFILLQWRKEYWIVFKPRDLEFDSYIQVSFREPHVWHLHANVTKPKKTYVRLMHLKSLRLITKLIKSKIYFTVFKEQHILFLHRSAFFLQYLQPPICVSQRWQRSPRKKGIAHNQDDSFCFNLTLRNLNTVWICSYLSFLILILRWISLCESNISREILRIRHFKVNTYLY